jgi:hypothetical protein
MVDQSSAEISCKWLLGGMAAAILAMGAALLGLAGYIQHLVKRLAMAEEQKSDLYDRRIADLKENHSLVDTLAKVVFKEKGGPR